MGLSSEVDEGWVGGSWRGEMGGKGGGGGGRGEDELFPHSEHRFPASSRMS